MGGVGVIRDTFSISMDATQDAKHFPPCLALPYRHAAK
jgi:hypothetical protein